MAQKKRIEIKMNVGESRRVLVREAAGLSQNCHPDTH